MTVISRELPVFALGEVREELRCGPSTIADATFGKRYFQDQVGHLAREFGANIVVVECLCPEPLPRRRLSNRQGNLVTDPPLQRFETQRRAFEPMKDLPEGMHIRVRTDVPVEQSLLVVFSETYLRQHREDR